MRITAEMAAQLAALRQQQRLRERKLTCSTDISFAGNDYLGLSRHARVRAAYIEGLQQWGAGSGASPAVTGFQPPHAYLCRQLAEWLERDDALLFSSGFAANHCVMRSIAPHYVRIIADKLSHASLIDGLLSANTTAWKRFRHNDAEHARQLLVSNGANLVVTESVFSMDGDRAPLAELAELPADLWVDDAHGLGVVGVGGRSTAAVMSQSQVPIITATFGKSLGVMGAAIVGSHELIAYLHTIGREYIYSTAFSGAQAAAISAAIEIIQSPEGERLRQQLAARVEYFRTCCQHYGIGLMASKHAIQIIPVGADSLALMYGQQLAAQGLTVGVIRPPTVAKGTARLRVTLTAQHSDTDIDRLVAALAQVYDRAQCS